MSFPIGANDSNLSFNSTSRQDEIPINNDHTNQTFVRRKRRTNSEKEQEPSRYEVSPETMLAFKSFECLSESLGYTFLRQDEGYNQSSISRNVTSINRRQEIAPEEDEEFKIEAAFSNLQISDSSKKLRRIDESFKESDGKGFRFEYKPGDSFRLPSSDLSQEKSYLEGMDEGLEDISSISETHLGLTDCNNEDLQKLLNNLLRFLEDKKLNDSSLDKKLLNRQLDKKELRKIRQDAKKFCTAGLTALIQALDPAKNDDDKMCVLKNISTYTDSYGDALSEQISNINLDLIFVNEINELEKALDLATEDAGKMSILENISKLAVDYGDRLLKKEKYLESEEKYRLSFSNLKKALDLTKNPNDRRRILENISKSYKYFGDILFFQEIYEEAEKEYDLAIIGLMRIVRSISDVDRMRILEDISNLYKLQGDALYLRTKYLKSETTYKQVINLYNQAKINAEEIFRLAKNVDDREKISKHILCCDDSIKRVQLDKEILEKEKSNMAIRNI